MIEVLDIQRNFKDGTEIIKKKYKEGKGTKGVATIQLFDENGLVQETISNNFITNPLGKKDLYAYLARELGTRQDSEFYSLLMKYGGESRFGQIQLRNGDFDEDPNEKFAKGEVIGYCPRTSTDAKNDVKRGTYNPTESFAKYESNGYYHCHLVYDFTTTQANGTFNHVYWNYDLGSSYPITEATIETAPYWYKYSTYGIKADIYIDAFGEILVKDSSNYHKVENTKHLLNGIDTVPKYDKSKIVEYIPSTYRVGKDHYVKFSSLYTRGTSPSTRTSTVSFELYNKDKELVKKKDINLLELTGFARINEAIGTYNGYINPYYQKFISNDGKIYFTVDCNAGTKKLPWFDANGSLLENNKSSSKYLLCYDIINENWYFNPNPYEEIKTTYGSKFGDETSHTLANNYHLGGNKYVAIGPSSAIQSYDLDNWVIKNVGAMSGNVYNGVDLYKGMVFVAPSGGYIRPSLIRPYTSHTKLPNPVTKISTTTMKITYDYYIQLPNLHCEVEGEEFNWE